MKTKQVLKCLDDVHCVFVKLQKVVFEAYLLATSLTKSASSRVFLFLSHTHLLPHSLACSSASDALRFSNSCPCPTHELGSCHFIDSVLPTKHLSDHVRP